MLGTIGCQQHQASIESTCSVRDVGERREGEGVCFLSICPKAWQPDRPGWRKMTADLTCDSQGVTFDLSQHRYVTARKETSNATEQFQCRAPGPGLPHDGRVGFPHNKWALLNVWKTRHAATILVSPVNAHFTTIALYKTWESNCIWNQHKCLSCFHLICRFPHWK